MTFKEGNKLKLKWRLLEYYGCLFLEIKKAFKKAFRMRIYYTLLRRERETVG